MKIDTSKVEPTLARLAISKSKLRTETYSEYIIAHYRATGNLAPGCNAADLYTWYEQNMPEEIAAITMPSQKRNAKNP